MTANTSARWMRDPDAVARGADPAGAGIERTHGYMHRPGRVKREERNGPSRDLRGRTPVQMTARRALPHRILKASPWPAAAATAASSRSFPPNEAPARPSGLRSEHGHDVFGTLYCQAL